MENAGSGAGAPCLAGELDAAEHTRPSCDIQALLDRAITHRWPAEALGAVLAARHPSPHRLLLATGALQALDPETRERLAEAALSDLRRGPPVPAFEGVRAEAEIWASYASPAEVKHYLVAGWNNLPTQDRRAFLQRVAA